MEKGETMDYGTFEKEALRFCRENGTNVTKYQACDNDDLHKHMFKFAVAQCKDAKEVLKICEKFEKKFWEKFRS